MAGSSLFTNLGRAAKVLALLLFFLPFVTVSCSTEALERIQSEAAQQSPQMRGPSLGGAEMPIASATGLNMALGKLTPTLNIPANAGSGTGSANQPPEVPIEIGVIAAAALILLALLGSILLKGPSGAIAGIGGCVLAIGALCYSVFVSYPPAVRAAFAATRNPSETGGSEHAPTADQIAQILSVKPATGFWLVLFMLVLAVVFNALAMRKPGAAVAPPTAA